MPRARRFRVFRAKSTSARRWIIARKITQYSALIIFILLFIISTHSGSIPGFVNFPMRLDPLLAIAHLLSSRIIISSFALALIVVALTFVFGRAWCGWICPLGTIIDVFSFKHGRQNPLLETSNDENWRKIKYSLLMAIIIAALFGNLTLLIFDPLTILFRTFSTSLWPGLDHIVTVLETSLINIAFLEEPIAVFDAWVRPAVLPLEPAYIPAAFLYLFLFLGIITLNFVAPRFWCRYLCPLGGLLGLISKGSLFRRQVNQDCKGCSLCERVCPAGTIDPELNFDSDPSECTLCLDCLDACPRSSIAFIPGSEFAKWREYDPSRRQALATLGLTIASLAVISADSRVKSPATHFIRPPGIIEDSFLSNCIRCAECMRACSTHALQPALLEGSLIGLWTPILIPRLGYCDYSCNKCGQVCPTQAIPPLPLEDKRKQVIGMAYIDQDRCLAWADHTDCIVCEEMCPLPEKAITLDVGQWQHRDGKFVQVQLPQVNRDLCIGCGICENKCPVAGEAAIRIYIPS